MKHACVSVVALLALAGAASAQFTGPSSSQSPYVLPTVGGVTTTSIFTVGDTVGGYRMVGIPDGLGAFANDGAGSFTLVMNHELGNTAGVTRAHGSAGAFVSQWTIGNNLAVINGRDQTTSVTNVYNWNGSGYTAGTTAWSRFCSGDLAGTGAYQFGNLGTSERIFLNGEENGAEGRAVAHVLTGPDANTSWQLPRLGRFSWENAVANPYAQSRTVVAGTDDNTVNGGVYFYVGDRQATGNTIERAGLTNGNLYGVQVQGFTSESRTTPPPSGTRFSLYNHGDVANTTGANLDASGAANGVMAFARPEDSAWDPRPGHQNDFYFVTTDRFNTPPGTPGSSRLWRMSFDDITNPTAGGTLSMLLDGAVNGFQMFDNLTIDTHGRILMQEDVGSNNYLGGVFLYDIASGGFGQIAQHDPARFLTGSAGFLTIDEESSGIIDAGAILGDGWFLLDSQAHYGISGELVEGGQLLAMYVPTSIVPTPAAAAVGLLGLGAAARRRRR